MPDYRNLEPVDPPPRPERLRMSLLKLADACPRSAYLYLKHDGGVPSPQLTRGTAGHAVFQAMLEEAIRQDEPMVDSDTALAIAEHVMEDYPLRAQDRDDIREMAFHISRRGTPGGLEVTGLGVDPQKIVGVEQRFVIPVEGWMVSCRLDLAAISGTVGEVTDWKTGFDFPTQEEVEHDFQLRIYAVALVYGHPETTRKVAEEPAKDGVPHQVWTREELEPPLGGFLTALRLRQAYPMLIDRETGEVLTRSHVIPRLQVDTDYEDLKALVRRFTASLDSGDFPAIRGDHCTRCPAPAECPLPAKLRDWRGAIDTPEKAAEAAEFLEAIKDRQSAVQRELRNVVKAHGPVRYGRDREMVLELVESYETDQEGLREGMAKAVSLGEPFDPADYRKPRRSNRLKVRTLSEGELGQEEPEVQDDDARVAWRL